jgi:hypothetical protein
LRRDSTQKRRRFMVDYDPGISIPTSTLIKVCLTNLPRAHRFMSIISLTTYPRHLKACLVL